MNLLARNAPVALIAGAAGFIGSHLAEGLLQKGIQVVGVDNLSTGSRENLKFLQNDKRFIFLKQSIKEKLPEKLPRLDYAFFTLPETLSEKEFIGCFENFLLLCEIYKCRVVLVSSIDLYDSEDKKLSRLRLAEKVLADKTPKKNINARVVRLSAVFGPRMRFIGSDPMVRLLKSVLAGESLEKSLPLDFSSRAIFVDDAVDLLVRAVMHGDTSKKIYDGVRRPPVKLSEIKQILSEPLWLENTNFTPTPLPDWITPNAARAETELLWKPRTNLVESLRKTVESFRQKEGKEKQQSPLKNEGNITPPKAVPLKSSNPGKTKEIRYFNFLGIFLGAWLIFYALIWPFLFAGFTFWSAKSNLEGSFVYLKKGQLESAAAVATEADNQAATALGQFNFWILPGKIGLFYRQWQAGEQDGQLIRGVTSGTADVATGTNYLGAAWQIITKGSQGNEGKTLLAAREQLKEGESQLNMVQGKLTNDSLLQKSAEVRWLAGWFNQVAILQQTADWERKMAEILMRINDSGGRQTYLVILQDNTALTSTGGKPLAAAEVVIDRGVMQKINPLSVSSKEGFAWYLPQFSDEADFSTFAEELAQLYKAQTGRQISGVVALDLTAAGKIEQTLSGKESENPEDLVGRIIGGQTQTDSVLALLLGGLQKKTPGLNQISFTGTLDKLLNEKHILVFAQDQQLQAVLLSGGWAGELPRSQVEKRGQRTNLLAISESDQGESHAAYYTSRQINLKSTLNDEGFISSRLTISYANSSPSEIWPGGSYIDKLKIFLPVSSTLNRVYWGEDDITSSVKSFTEYGWAGNLMTVELKAGEQKNLVLEYQDLEPVDFQNNQFNLSQEVIKQPGTREDKIEYSFVFPADFRLIEPSDLAGQQQFMIDETLDSDKNWVLAFQKESR